MELNAVRQRKSTFVVTAMPLLLVALAGCDGKSPTTPMLTEPQAQPQPQQPAGQPPPAPQTFAYSGRLVRTLADTAISGATVLVEGQSSTTDGGGSFTLTFQAPVKFPAPARIEAGGHITRETAFRANNSTLDLISLSAPFNLRFYSELVRGTVDQNGPNPLQRWTTAPAIAISPTTESGTAVDPAVLDVVETSIRESFTQWTGGRLNFSHIERRAMAEGQGGWIVVHFFERGPVCAQASNWVAAGNSAQVASSSLTFFLRTCACGSRRITPRTVAHELGHALGFEHTTNPDTTMYSYVAEACDRSERGLVTPIEQHHAAIAYTRQPGNVEPDSDPREPQSMSGRISASVRH